MSKTLYLIRHASAEEPDSRLKDLERRLTAVGRRDANHLGMYLASSQVQPDLIVTSNAHRAVETAEIIAEQLRYGVDKIKQSDDLYEAPIRILLRTINAFTAERDLVLLIGHNPAISFLADYLTAEDIDNMAPCATVALEFDLDDWTSVAAQNGNSKFVRSPD